MNDKATILAVNGLELRRGGARVLEVPQFALRQAEVVCFIGPNGSGKTTLLLALASLLEPHAGELLFKAQPVAGRSAALAYRRKTATVFQEPLLFDATVAENVAAGLKIRSMPGEQVRRLVEQNLERFRIGHLAQRSARRLSGGEAQRTSLARAFAVNPEILFLDEPFSALDPLTREALLEDLEKAFRETGIAVAMTSHDQVEALRLADTMAVLQQGRIVQTGAPAEVINFPVNEFVASFVGMGTVLTGTVMQASQGIVGVRVADHLIQCSGEAPVGRQVLICIRPENVVIGLPASHDITSVRNQYAGVITRLVPMGHFFKVQLDCGFFLTSHITSQSLVKLGLQQGSPIVAAFKATAVHMIVHA